MEAPIWNSEKRRVADLKDWPYNPRKISEQSYKRLVERIRTRGFHDVIKIDTHGQILSGNMRRRALMELGHEEVNVLVPSRELTQEEAESVVIENNRSDGEWDFDILANHWDVEELKDLGFEPRELHFFDADEDDFDEKKTLDSITVPVAQRGDVFVLGNHRIMCGDSTSMDDVGKLMTDTKCPHCGGHN